MTSSPVTLAETDHRRLASAWRSVDPVPSHVAAIDAALASKDSSLERLFAPRLRFGTAGLRGPLGPGPGAMNRVVVRLVAAALANVVRSQGGQSVVIGYDARQGSRDFAHDTAQVLAAHEIESRLFDRVTPTPVVAFAVKELGAGAGVMVTASHNPRSDNGYKVYGADGALLASPADRLLAERVHEIPLFGHDELASPDDHLITSVGHGVIDAYLDRVIGLLQAKGKRSIRLAYTPLHGVGGQTMLEAFDRAGFSAVTTVPSQHEPNGDFPGMHFPNPEEPGVLEELLEVATTADAQIAIANDPDADRVSVAAHTASGWHLLSGDDLGCLLADYLLVQSEADGGRRLVINTVVSSRLLSLIADHHRVHFTQALTGFKWIMNAQSELGEHRFVLGYEEALGYTISDAVRDKDGISAALVIAEFASELAAQDRSLLDALDDLHRRHGVHVTGQRSIRFEVPSGPTPAVVMKLFRDNPPTELAGLEVTRTDDLLVGREHPPTDAMILHLEGCRLTVRPSGTEPKLKVYGEAWQSVAPDAHLRSERAVAHRRLVSTLDALTALISDPERNETARELANAGYASDETVQNRADELFASEPESLSRAEALGLAVRSIDLTTLTGDDTAGRVRALCAQARRPDPADATIGPTAAICVYPNLVPVAAEVLAGSGVKVASVASAFPSGLSSLEVRLTDIADAIASGADEIDVVLNRAAFLSGEHELVRAELTAMRETISDRVMKVIIETGELQTAPAIRGATDLAIRCGADWVKTSTGKSAVSATPASVLVMARSVADHVDNGGDPVGVKISGGVRTSSDALGYLAIIESTLGPDWLHPERVRFGASGLLTAVVADIASER